MDTNYIFEYTFKAFIHWFMIFMSYTFAKNYLEKHSPLKNSKIKSKAKEITIHILLFILICGGLSFLSFRKFNDKFLCYFIILLIPTLAAILDVYEKSGRLNKK